MWSRWYTRLSVNQLYVTVCCLILYIFSLFISLCLCVYLVVVYCCLSFYFTCYQKWWIKMEYKIICKPKFRRHTFIHGIDVRPTSLLPPLEKKQTVGLLEFNFWFWFLPYYRQCHIILHRHIEFRPNWQIGPSPFHPSYRFCSGWSGVAIASLLSYYGDVALLRRSKCICAGVKWEREG